MSLIIMQVTNLSKDLTFNTKINPKKQRKKKTKISDIRTSKGPKKFNNQTQKLLKLSKKKCMTAKQRGKRYKSGYPQIANQPIKFRH